MTRSISILMVFQFFYSGLSAQLDFSNTALQTAPLLKQMDTQIKEGTYEQITSVLIAQHGKLVFEQYYQNQDQESLHNTRSATKTLATLLTGMAIDHGYIQSETDPIFVYLTHKLPVQNPDPRKESITIEDLMTMSSILECDDGNYFSRGNEERMYIIEDWTQFFLDLPIKSYPFGPKPEESPYGRVFSYCSAGSATVADIVESAIPGKLDVFAKTHLFDPLGFGNYTLHYSPMNILNTAGGSEYRSRDLLRLIQLCLNHGQWNGKQLISSEWIDKATSPKVQARENVKYGYLFWLNPFGKDQQYDAYYMSGNGGNKLVAIPELDLTVVITATNYGNRKMHQYTDELMNAYIVPAMEN